MEDLVCPGCGAANDAQARYCDQCARPLARPAADAPEDACPACGGKVDEEGGRHVCAGCGLEFRRAEEEPAAVEPPAAAPPAAVVPCPLCGEPTRDDAPSCASCGLWFDAPRRPQPCPRCGQPAGPDSCACGAILTLDRLLEFLAPAVRFVCRKCKTPYARLPDASATKCPDCGGGLLSAQRLKDYARSLAG